METKQGLFVGYKNFVSKKSNKNVFILSFLILTESEEGDRVDYFVADIFVTEENYNKFLQEHEILKYVPIKLGIVGDKIRYYI